MKFEEDIRYPCEAGMGLKLQDIPITDWPLIAKYSWIMVRLSPGITTNRDPEIEAKLDTWYKRLEQEPMAAQLLAFMHYTQRFPEILVYASTQDFVQKISPYIHPFTPKEF